MASPNSEHKPLRAQIEKETGNAADKGSITLLPTAAREGRGGTTSGAGGRERKAAEARPRGSATSAKVGEQTEWCRAGEPAWRFPVLGSKRSGGTYSGSDAKRGSRIDPQRNGGHRGRGSDLRGDG